MAKDNEDTLPQPMRMERHKCPEPGCNSEPVTVAMVPQQLAKCSNGHRFAPDADTRAP